MSQKLLLALANHRFEESLQSGRRHQGQHAHGLVSHPTSRMRHAAGDEEKGAGLETCSVPSTQTGNVNLKWPRCDGAIGPTAGMLHGRLAC